MRSFIWTFLILSAWICPIFGESLQPLPIGFSMPESKIVDDVPEKDQDFAYIIPGDLSTYIYERESDYYKDYQRSYFALTRKKAGWDCLRHYEILANGCIPYFIDLDQCDENTMSFLPKELIKEAMHLEGVSLMHIDHQKFDRAKYHEILEKLLTYTREHLTTKQIASYILKSVNYSGEGKILYLSQDINPDYLRCLVLEGFKELLNDRIVDIPKIPHIYKNYPQDILNLYGRGMTYTKLIEDLPVNRENIEQRIAGREFDLIIYGSVHRGLPYYDLVVKTYEPDRIVYLCGEDAHRCQFSHLHNLFLREFEAYVHQEN
jgi:hypothetical protein